MGKIEALFASILPIKEKYEYNTLPNGFSLKGVWGKLSFF